MLVVPLVSLPHISEAKPDGETATAKISLIQHNVVDADMIEDIHDTSQTLTIFTVVSESFTALELASCTQRITLF